MNKNQMSTSNQQFTFEKLVVWNVAKEALVLILGHKARLKGIPGEVASQLERAAVSVVCNIAEGAGRSSANDQRNRYVIARGEANEAAAMVEVAAIYGAIGEELHGELRGRHLSVTRMLNAMIAR